MITLTGTSSRPPPEAQNCQVTISETEIGLTTEQYTITCLIDPAKPIKYWHGRDHNFRYLTRIELQGERFDVFFIEHTWLIIHDDAPHNISALVRTPNHRDRPLDSCRAKEETFDLDAASIPIWDAWLAELIANEVQP